VATVTRGSGPQRAISQLRARRSSSRDPRWPKISLIVGIVLAVVSGLFVGGTKLVNWYANSKVHQEHLLAPDPQGKNISGPINLLLLGMDERGNSTDLIHTDSIIIVHVNATHNRVSMISVPRDSLVAVPPFPASNFPGTSRAKLTEAFAFGNQKPGPHGGVVGDDSAAGRARGVELLTQVLSGLVPNGLVFNAVAIINYVGFQKIVEALGGVNLCVDETTYSEHYNKDGKYVGETYGVHSVAKTYKKGCYHFEPWEALDFVRQRHYLENGDGDYGRQRHQQQFLMAVFQEMFSSKTLSDPKKIIGLINAAGNLLTMDLNQHSVLDWLFTLKNIRPSDIMIIKTNAGKYSGIQVNGTDYEQIVPDTLKLLQAVHDDAIDDFLATHTDWAGSTRTASSPTPSTKPSP
jgi:anionic cell wall polymer biosynthesis LytR-Cps2A-Psr (LCP) family protein